MDSKQLIATGIAVQTQVLKTCPEHTQLYFDDDANMDRAFALAVELVRQRKPYVQPFWNDAHELTDLLSYTIGTAPECCPDCKSPREHAFEHAADGRGLSWLAKRSGENLIESNQAIALR